LAPPRPRVASADTRAADADRERVVGELLRHAAEGRLEPEELAVRTERAYAAATLGELGPLTADLPVLAGGAGVPASAAPPARRTLALVGGASRLGRWRPARDGLAVAVLGSCRLDLRRAEFDAPQVAITALAYWGRVEVVVPDGAEVEMTGVGVVSSRDVNVRPGPAPVGFPRVCVRAYAAIGSVKVKSRPVQNLGQRLRARLAPRG
jgi:hypothetical protein